MPEKAILSRESAGVSKTSDKSRAARRNFVFRTWFSKSEAGGLDVEVSSAERRLSGDREVMVCGNYTEQLKIVG